MCRLLLSLFILFGVTSARSADYWPDDSTRTYVFGSGADQIRFVIDPRGGGAVEMRFVGQGCDVAWFGTLATDGTFTVSTGEFFCAGVVDPVLPLVFDPPVKLFDPTKIGGAIQAFPAQGEGSEFVVSTRIGIPRSIVFEGETVEVVLFEFGIEDPLLLAPAVTADLSITEGPLRVNGLDRTQVFDGVVRDTAGTWSAIKARY